MNFRPFAVGQIVGLVENLWKLAAAQGETIASVLTRSENGFSVKWVELQKQNHAKRTLCFCSSGEMTPSDRAGSAATYEYFDFSPFRQPVTSAAAAGNETRNSADRCGDRRAGERKLSKRGTVLASRGGSNRRTELCAFD